MITITDRIAELKRLESIINLHLVGGKLTVHPGHILYIFNEVWDGRNGIRVSSDNGKIWAYRMLIKALDKTYNDTFSWSRHHTKLESDI